MAGFYITVPSNTMVSATKGENTTAEFRAPLPKTITLDGFWEIAMVQLQYPRSWYNLQGQYGGTSISLGNTHNMPLVASVPDGYYETAEELCLAIHRAINLKAPGTPIAFFADGNHKVRYKQPSNLRCIHVAESIE